MCHSGNSSLLGIPIAVNIWDVASGDILATHEAPFVETTCAVLSPDPEDRPSDWNGRWKTASRTSCRTVSQRSSDTSRRNGEISPCISETRARRSASRWVAGF